tara:strand:+ start:572 stop:1015 length:444 start_codon:yes stop_codon:yes gene_type:complete
MSRASDLANLIASGSTTIFGEAGVTSSGSTGLTTNLQQGLAKAWINFDGTSTGSVDTYDRGSLNCAVIIDNGTGDYRIGFTNNMANVNYSISVNGRNSTTARTVYNCGGPSQTDPTSENFEVAAFNESGNAYINPSHMYAQIHGDLA